ncbi:DUF4296 domain-containing protein [Winogradskyella flava]|uniref:DUF4296 domain-containing protein n=1 Tax=Winogradskyella flava TaxID=1884876 RepID=A0A842IPR3_9FLAO|nr:DUF4296 domain-containing protein [Winogradskyella flava]MBC2844179.1 DUF4296 domain-containing protein [Winogradskyella flava]
MKKFGAILVLFVLVVACNIKDKPKKPNNLISKNKMEQILYDLYIINAAKGVNRKLLENNGLVPETYILTKHNIDSAQFAISNTYYAFYSDTYKDIVENVKAKIEKQQEEYEELKEIEEEAAKRKRDSLKKINSKKKDSITRVKTIKKLDSAKVL